MTPRWMVTLLACSLLVGGCTKKAGAPAPEAQERAAERKAGPGPAGPPPAGGGGPRLTRLWAADGLKVPESVLYDAARSVLYVSCINGAPTEKNGQGFIAQLSPAGELLAPRWATGINAPKGMGLSGDTLYVTDIDRLHAVDVSSGKIRSTVDAPQARFLNDIAVGPSGRVFVSDMVTGQVFVLQGGALAPFADLRALKGANGMLLHRGQLLVGTATGIARVDLETGGATRHVAVEGFGMIDGLRTYADDAWVISNWQGRTQLVRADGSVQLLLDTTAQKIQAADLEYVAASKTLLIPTFFDNRVVAYRLE